MKRGDRNEKKLVICYKNGMDVLYNIAVAPLAGAWIEISSIMVNSLIFSVAPLAGAWIEILPRHQDLVSSCVAPLAGAWIEIKLAAML